MKYALQQDATSHITGFQNTVSSYAVYFFCEINYSRKGGPYKFGLDQ